MKPGLFQYVRADTVEDALSLCQELGENSSFLAGGQSLVPAMALRMASPEYLIDISSIAELQVIKLDGGTLHIGAGCRYADVLQSPVVADAAPILAQAIPFIAHEAIRNRGTIGGSLAHADPASELPACMIMLGATIVLKSNVGERKIAAGRFFLGTYFTEMAEGELLVGVEIPAINAGTYHRFSEISRRSGDYAISGGAFSISFEADTVTAARLAFFAVSDRAVLATSAAEVLVGKTLDDETVATASQMVADELDFLGDLYNGTAAKRQITKVLTKRLLSQFIGRGQ